MAAPENRLHVTSALAFQPTRGPSKRSTPDPQLGHLDLRSELSVQGLPYHVTAILNKITLYEDVLVTAIDIKDIKRIVYIVTME